jgi:serine protease Do
VSARRAAALAAVTGALAALVTAALVRTLWPPEVTPAQAAESISASRRTAIVTAAERVSPAVVSVSVVQSRIVRADPFRGLFHDQFFDFFYPQTEYKQQVPGLGSGVIVDRSGIVLTNEHVVHDADQITVTLKDGRQFKAKLLGASPTYDLAVLQVEGERERLPVAPMGKSDDLVVGEWAIAIGNPFGFLLEDTQPSVTAGVISATRRNIKAQASSTGVYMNMIQTDAAINPGNSGGPLVNGSGEVIGINTFIFTQGGGSLGIGFAIPIDLVRKLLDEIRTHGRVRVAWPGMQVQAVTPQLARRLGTNTVGGLVVSGVDRGGPAEKAGIRVRDRIRQVNGRNVDSVEDARRSIYGAGVGDRLTLRIERGGQASDVTLTLAEAPR